MSEPHRIPADGQCQIRYRDAGVIHEWGVGCDAHADTEESMLAHLLRWKPNAEFLGCCITRVKDNTVISDTRREMTDIELRVEKLEQMQRDMNAGFEHAIVTLKGSVEFRNAVEALLVGTPYEKPADDFEGLYGRLRTALAAGPIYPGSDRGLKEMCPGVPVATLRGIQEAAFRAGRESVITKDLR